MRGGCCSRDATCDGLSDHVHARLLREQIGLAGPARPGSRRADARLRGDAPGNRRAQPPARGALACTAALEQVGAEHCAERQWEELSDWERALVEIAQAIAGTPRLLLIDDVIDGFGMRETDELARLVRALAEDHEIGVLMAVSDAGGGALLAPGALARGWASGVNVAPAPDPADAAAPSYENVIDFPRDSESSLRDARRQ